jgi:hypothetical protein
MFAIWRYSIYSVMVGRYSSLLNSPPFLMILDLFESTTCPDLEISHIFCFGR